MVKSNIKKINPEDRLREMIIRAKEYAESNQLRMVAAIQQDLEQPLKGVALSMDDDPIFCAGVIQILGNHPAINAALVQLAQQQKEDETPYIIGKDWGKGGLTS